MKWDRPIVITLSLHLSVPFDLVCKHFDFDRITQIIYIIHFSDFV